MSSSPPASGGKRFGVLALVGTAIAACAGSTLVCGIACERAEERARRYKARQERHADARETKAVLQDIVALKSCPELRAELSRRQAYRVAPGDKWPVLVATPPPQKK